MHSSIVILLKTFLNCRFSILQKTKCTLQVGDADGIMQLMRERRILVIDTVLCNTFLDCARADGSMEALELAQDMLAQMQGDKVFFAVTATPTRALPNQNFTKN